MVNYLYDLPRVEERHEAYADATPNRGQPAGDRPLPAAGQAARMTDDGNAA